METAAQRYRQALVTRLKALIEDQGVSVAEVERRLGHSRGYLGDALRGDKRLNLETLLDVLELLETPPASFFSGRSDPWRRLLAGEVAEGAAAYLAGPCPCHSLGRGLEALLVILQESGTLSEAQALRVVAAAQAPVESRSRNA